MNSGGGRAVAALAPVTRHVAAFPPLAIPCVVCHEPAAYLTAPVLSGVERAAAIPILKLLSLKVGRSLSLPESGNIFDLVNAAQLAELLNVTCWECAEIAEAARD